MKMIEARKGLRVIYVPNHANGDIKHPDCEVGCISSMNGAHAFVKYDNKECKMITGDEPYTAKATNWENLIKL